MTALSPTGLQVIERLDNTLSFWIGELTGPDHDLAVEAIGKVDKQAKLFTPASQEERDALAELNGGLFCASQLIEG